MTAMPHDGRRRVAIVTNIPAPYRIPVFDRLAAIGRWDLRVYYCSGRESDRAWDLPATAVDHAFLRERVWHWRGRYVHCNPDVWPALGRWRPQLVVTTGFNPTHLIAWSAARRLGARHVAMTDGTPRSEASLSALHRLLRRRVYAASSAFVGASAASRELYARYGVPADAWFQSHLCADNDAYRELGAVRPGHDLVWSGRFVPGKLPAFAVRVAALASRRIGRRLRLLMLGSGPLEEETRALARALAADVDCRFAGFARQAELPLHYASARLLLFPTTGDTWGVVANEACAAGRPVVVSPQAGCAGELVVDGDNGRVLDLDADAWADAVARLLTDEALAARMGRRSIERVAAYTYEAAAAGLDAALLHACARPQPRTTAA